MFANRIPAAALLAALSACSGSTADPTPTSESFGTTGPCRVRRLEDTTIQTCNLSQTVDGVAFRWTQSTVSSPVAALPTGAPLLSQSVTTSLLANGQLAVTLHREIDPTDKPTLDGTLSYSYGPLVTGARTASLTLAGGTVSGSIDGNAITPYTISDGTSALAARFADGSATPQPKLDATVTAALADFLPKLETFKAGLHVQTLILPLDPIEGGGIPAGSGPGSTPYQNTFINYATPGCQQCEHDCATDWKSYVVPGYLLACQYGCFIPTSCCNGSCCTGTCMPDGSCCPTSQQTCGSACCGSGQVCLDAASSRCGVPVKPALQIFDQGRLLTSSPVLFSNSTLVDVHGLSFQPGPVTLTISPYGNTSTLATVTADGSGAFVYSSFFPTGQYPLVATQGSVSSSIPLSVYNIP